MGFGSLPVAIGAGGDKPIELFFAERMAAGKEYYDYKHADGTAQGNQILGTWENEEEVALVLLAFDFSVNANVDIVFRAVHRSATGTVLNQIDYFISLAGDVSHHHIELEGLRLKPGEDFQMISVDGLPGVVDVEMTLRGYHEG